MTRREARELAFILLFERSFTEEPVEEILAAAEEARDVQTDRFAIELACGAEQYLPQLDEKIAACSRNWSRERISRVAMAVMRLALYEMLYVDSIPVSVSINEAVELARKYGGDEDPAFINGVLGGAARSLAAQAPSDG